MTKLRVYAHHGPAPSGFLTASLPELPLPGTPGPFKEFWCELNSQSIVDAPPGSDGAGYGPSDAVAPDEWRWDLGYPPTADGFAVTGLCVLLVGAPQDDYDYLIISPSGVRIAVPPGLASEPLAPMPEWGNPEDPYSGIQVCWPLADAVTPANGLWRIQLFQKEGSTAEPVETSWANGVSSVQLSASAEGGFLALEFTGVEVAATTTTTTTTTATTTPPSLRDRLGWFGTTVLLIALALTASAAVSFFVWACRGYVSIGLFATAVSLAAAALFVLPTWTLLFRTGKTLDILVDWFAWLSAGTPLLAAVFAIIGELDCAAGVLIVSGLFGTLLAIVTVADRFLARRRLRA